MQGDGKAEETPLDNHQHPYQTVPNKALRQNDIDLAVRVVAGEEDAVTSIFQNYQEAVTRYIYVIAPRMNEGDLEDVVQETFMGVLRSIKDYRGDSSLSTWILRIAYNKTIDLLRKHQPNKESVFSDLASEDEDHDIIEGDLLIDDRCLPIEDEIIQEEEISRIRSILEGLPDNERLAISYRYMYGMRVEQVAEMMQLPRRTVELHITRGRKMIRERYKHMQELLES